MLLLASWGALIAAFCILPDVSTFPPDLSENVHLKILKFRIHNFIFFLDINCKDWSIKFRQVLKVSLNNFKFQIDCLTEANSKSKFLISISTCTFRRSW